MSIKDLEFLKLSKLVSEYNDELKCLECCKYFLVPTTAACGHTLCHTCWRGRRTCARCGCPLDRRSLKLNFPLQNLTTQIQTLSIAFENLFRYQLSELDFSLDIPGDLESGKDSVENVKEWLTSSQNHFSEPILNSETVSQESQHCNPLEISSSKIIIHTDVRKCVSPPIVTKMVHVPTAQDDWDKIEAMPDVENVVGPMDIEPFFVKDSEYNTNNPRRSSRKRDLKHDNSMQKSHNLSSNRQNSRDSSFENDKKSQKSKQTWSNVKRMRKEFSKLNKKKRGKLNVSIEMVKKTQNVKPISNIPPTDTQLGVNIDENTPMDGQQDNITFYSKSCDKNQHSKPLENMDEISSDKSNLMQSLVEPQTDNATESNNNNTAGDTNMSHSNSVNNNEVPPKELETVCESSANLKEKTRMQFMKKGPLCPKKVEVITCDNNIPNMPEQQNTSGKNDDIEISIKVGGTITNIVIKKKNDVQVNINTDCEVQTSLGPHKLHSTGMLNAKDSDLHNIDISIGETNKQNTQINIIESGKTIVATKTDKSTSEKKNTVSADTHTTQFEITESVEKELSNIMEYKASGGQNDTFQNILQSEVQHVDTVKQVQENLKSLKTSKNYLDIFSGSVKEATVQILEEHAPSEVLISTVCSKLKNPTNPEKRNRDAVEDEILPKNKKVKVTSQHTVKDLSAANVLPDSEPISYDAIMGQVFASIDADMEDIRRSQQTQSIKVGIENQTRTNQSKNKGQAQKPHITKQTQESNIHNMPRMDYLDCEKIYTLNRDDEYAEAIKNDKMPEVQILLTPIQSRNLNVKNTSQKNNNKSITKSQDLDDSDRSIVEETPQKDLSFTKVKRTSALNLSQFIAICESQKIAAKVSERSSTSIINLTDTVRESNESNKDMTIVEPLGKKPTLESPVSITKFADHIIHKSTPVARKSLIFDNENDDNDLDETLCRTSEVVAKTTQEKEFLAKAFESTLKTPSARPLMDRNIMKTNKKYCLVASRLSTDEIVKVKILCAQQKWRYVEKYSKDITHLVVSVDEENKSQRSVKYMSALADAKWIVSFAWIERCLRTKTVADEEQFEALDSFGEPGPRRSRYAKQKLFQGIKFFCMPPFGVLEASTLENMLKAAGGRVVKDIKNIRVMKDASQPALLLAEPQSTQEDHFIYLAMEHSIVPVNFEWVLNCLGSYTLGSIQELLLCPSSLLPEATALWPEVLIAQDYD